MTFGRRDLEQLLAEGRFEEALSALLLLRAEAPDNESVSRAILHLKERLLTEYLARLGALDACPSLTAAASSPEERLVARLVDGKTSLATVLERSPLGKLPTARLLTRWRTGGALVTPTESPEDVEALLDQASEACLARRFDDACAVYERCAVLAPAHPRVVHNLSRLRQLTRTR